MGLSVEQLAVAVDSIGPCPRREPREETVRIVEYTPFPRVEPQAGPRIGFTRDISNWGMCFAADEPEEVGALLRVSLRELDGERRAPCVERVVWCSPTGDGRYWIGLERLTSGRHR